MTETGSASAGQIVAVTLRRKMKITSTTSTAVSASVNCTSLTELRIETERSSNTSRWTEAGSCASNTGSSLLIASTSSTVLASGWRWTASMTAFLPLNQLPTWSFSTLSMAFATSRSRTGAPLR